MHEEDDPRSDAEHDALYNPELHDSEPDYYETEYLVEPDDGPKCPKDQQDQVREAAQREPVRPGGGPEVSAPPARPKFGGNDSAPGPAPSRTRESANKSR